MFFHAPESLSVPINNNEIQLSVFMFFVLSIFRQQDVDNDTECWTQSFSMSTDEILIGRWILIFVFQRDKIGTNVASAVFIQDNIIYNVDYTLKFSLLKV